MCTACYEGEKEVRPSQSILFFGNTRFRQQIRQRQPKKLLEALDAKTDKDYHISDSVREADEQPGNGQVTAWTNTVKKQLFGK
jgi:hypothetical protein